MESEWIISPIPPCCTAEGAEVVLGIDEAGRGPLLGPLVYGCAYWCATDEASVGKLGFADSKVLTEAKRDALFETMQRDARVGWAVEAIPAALLSGSMLRRTPVSLNATSHASAAALVRAALDRGVRVKRVYVDTVGDPGAYAARLSRAFGPGIDFTVCPKADALYPCVSAASIAAKVTRDRLLREWVYAEPLLRSVCGPPLGAATPAAKAVCDDDGDAASIGASGNSDDDVERDPAALRTRAVAPSLGGRGRTGGSGGSVIHPSHAKSGYPGDPATKAWAAATFDPIFGWPNVVRFSWSTAKDYLAEHGAAVDWGDEGPEGSGGGSSAAPGATSAGSQAGLGSYFASAAPPASSLRPSSGVRCSIPPVARPPFFRKRHLRPVTDFI